MIGWIGNQHANVPTSSMVAQLQENVMIMGRQRDKVPWFLMMTNDEVPPLVQKMC